MARCHFVVDRDPMSAVIQGAAGPVPIESRPVSCREVVNETGNTG